MAITSATNLNRMVTISYTAGESLASLIAVINAFITGHGWELFYTSANSLHYVFRTLDEGGTAGNASHYTYIELDYETAASKVILRLWQSWSGIAGISKANNLAYQPTVGGSSLLASSESQIGQPLDMINGGSVELIVGPGHIHLITFTTSGLIGCIANNCGVAVFSRTRVESFDVVGVCPAGVYMNMGGKFSGATGNQAGFNKFSLAYGIDGSSNNASEQSGKYGGIYMPRTGEYFSWWSDIQQTHALNNQNSTSGKYPASVIELKIGNTTTFATVNLEAGVLKNCARKYQTSISGFGDIITVNADSNGIPSPTGTPTTYYVVRGGLGIQIS